MMKKMVKNYDAKEYRLKMGNVQELLKYILFLESCEFEGSILTGSEMLDAKDLLAVCGKFMRGGVRLRISRGNREEIESYLQKNGLMDKQK